jgi:hypothetical protein
MIFARSGSISRKVRNFLPCLGVRGSGRVFGSVFLSSSRGVSVHLGGSGGSRSGFGSFGGGCSGLLGGGGVFVGGRSGVGVGPRRGLLDGRPVGGLGRGFVRLGVFLVVCLRRRVAGLATLDLVFVLLLSDLSILCFLLDVAVGLLAGRVSLSLDGGGRRSAWSIYLRGRNDLVVLEAIDNLTIEVR